MVRNEPQCDLTQISQTFPADPINLILRPNFLDTIDDLFESVYDIVLLEAQEGIGKTTLASQFCRRYKEKTISLFVNPGSRWGCDPIYLMNDLCNQINWIVNGKELEGNDIDETLLRTLLIRLQRIAKRETHYFVVDGFDLFSQENHGQIKPILDLLPISLPGFKFLISADSSKKLPLSPVMASKTKSYPISYFTLSETASYFDNDQLTKDHIKEIQLITKGIPEKLFGIKRILVLEKDKEIESLPYGCINNDTDP